MKRQICDGAKFWNPYEGLGVAADLLRLARSWVESGVLKHPTRPKQDAIKALQELEARTRAMRPVVKAGVQEWHDVRIGKRPHPNPIRMGNGDDQTVLGLRDQIKQIQVSIEASQGSMQLRNLAIDFPKAEIRFTLPQYFDFVYRSLDEVIDLCKDGELRGPSPDQIY